MLHDAFLKLRTNAINAYAKIVLRARDMRPGKWPETGYNEEGIRDWRLCQMSFLFDKLDEEVAELKEAVRGSVFDEVLKEAGDVVAIAMLIADKKGCYDLSSRRQPKVVCLCGSTKFKDAFEIINAAETMKGNIVLSVGFFHHSQTALILRDSEKEDLDFLHKRKIDLADEILVINVKGYIGDSTRSEIEYAIKTGKGIRYMMPPVHLTPPIL